MNRKLRLPLALAMALGSSHALALGLGQIEVKSGLYQPLDAQIPVLSTTANEAANLKVRLASAEDFARVGLDSSSMLSANLEFSVKQDASGKPVIHVSTDSKLNDPFVTFLLEVDWGKGRMLREFTVLLDPPLTAPVAGSRAPTRVPSAIKPVAREPVQAVEPAQAEPLPAEPASRSAPPPSIPAETSPAPEPEAPAPVEPAPAPAPAPAAAAPAVISSPGGEYGP
ncbi:MAG: ferrous iron transporter B, partial [Xanthomonadales bacterium]|nr:ferrous iron transporter B [Xanthomonadales bacterium]